MNHETVFSVLSNTRASIARTERGDSVVHATVFQVLVAIGSGRDFDWRSLTVCAVVQLGTEGVRVDGADAVVEWVGQVDAACIAILRSLDDSPHAVVVDVVEEDQVPLVSAPETGRTVTEAESRAALTSLSSAAAAGVYFAAVEAQTDRSSCRVVRIADRCPRQSRCGTQRQE